MFTVEANLKCDSCGKEENRRVSYKPSVGFEVGEKWFAHGWTKFFQCRECFDKTNRRFLEAKKQATFWDRLKGGRWWYEFAKGHWAYKQPNKDNGM